MAGMSDDVAWTVLTVSGRRVLSQAVRRRMRHEKHLHRAKSRAHKESWACRKARPASAQTQESGSLEDLDEALPLCSPSKCLSMSEAELGPTCRI